MRTLLYIGAFCMLAGLPGCAMHNVTFLPSTAIKAPASAQATVIHGNIDEAVRLMEQARLPHHTLRQRLELETQARRALTAQLGSDDYVILGEIYGAGNAYSDFQTLSAAFSKKAAAAGGDVVLIFRTGVENRPFVFTTPGYANTTMQYSAYSYGNVTHGTATAYTTYTPGQTYTGTMYLPYANGLVFKHVASAADRRRRLAALSDSQLQHVFNELEALTKTSITWDDYVTRTDQIISGGDR